MIIEPIRPFLACEFRVKFATLPWERNRAAGLRREVFCGEQGIFRDDDQDAIDEIAIPLVALSSLAITHEDVVGTVRIHEEGAGLWWGSRLAVARSYRKVGAIGTSLIRLAVCSAHARGCQRFLAHVQSQNATLFHALHWETLDEVLLHGHPHHFMQADLDVLSATDDSRDRVFVASETGRLMFRQIVETSARQPGHCRKSRYRGRHDPAWFVRRRHDPGWGRLCGDP